ncbi:hypothetical protein PG990_008644 [Apiospora arundinis]
MCLTIFTHHCPVGHETRPLSTLNPATAYTVFNPYAEPARNPCKTPCCNPMNGATINPEIRCFWHGDCCRLVLTQMCGAFDRSQCSNDIPYHLRKELTAEGGEAAGGIPQVSDDEAPLPFLGEEPWFVALRWDFFMAGTDLHKAGAWRTHYAAALKRAKNKKDSLSLPSPLSPSKATEWDDDPTCIVVATGRILRDNTTKNKAMMMKSQREKKAEKWYADTDRKYREKAHYLAQLAQVWDRNAAHGLCTPRPGRWPDAKLAWPGYACVDLELGVRSMGYDLWSRGDRRGCWPPPKQQLFETHHFPRKVEVAGPQDQALGTVGDGDGSDIASAHPSVYPSPPPPPPASYAPAIAPPPSPPSFSLYPIPPSSARASSSTTVTPAAASSDPSPRSSSLHISIPPSALENAFDSESSAQASLEQYLAGEDELITSQIRETGEPQELFSRYLGYGFNVVDDDDDFHNAKVPDDESVRVWDSAMRDRIAAAREEVVVSPQSSTVVLLPRVGETETRRVGVDQLDR